MRPLARGFVATCAALLAALAGCSIDSARNPRFGCEGCPDDQCHMGFCFATGDEGDGGSVILDGGGGSIGDGGQVDPGDAGPDASAPPPEDCDEPGATEFCYGGPSGSATVGACRAGMRVCEGTVWSACLGQVIPSDERCNGVDDDCDGTSDEEVMLGSCDTEQDGICSSGALRCEGGVAFCDRAVDPIPEECNGEDDDCDAEMDEEIDSRCFPDSAMGCAPDGAGGFVCQGICRAGMRVCNGGVPEPCDGFVPAGVELCDTGGTAADENCDGTSDEGCICTPNDTQPCYSGPEDTEGVGICMAGNQTCDANGAWGACNGEVMPGEESCLNEGEDDDCNGMEDDILRRGEPCQGDDTNHDGICRDGTWDCGSSGNAGLVCVPRPAVEEDCNGEDDDCDGKTDETFDLTSDPLHCGTCERACRGAEACCNGECADLVSNERYCGSCTNPCGNGLECCNSNCENTQTSPMHCGGCNQPCGIGGFGCCSGGICMSGPVDPVCL